MESGSLTSINDFLKKLSIVDMFAGACTLVAVSISGYQITRHLLHFNEQKIQLQIIRILVIIPVSLLPFIIELQVYSISTYLSIMFA